MTPVKDDGGGQFLAVGQPDADLGDVVFVHDDIPSLFELVAFHEFGVRHLAAAEVGPGEGDGRLAVGFVGGIARVWDVYGRLVVQAAGVRADCLAFDRSGRLAIGGPAGLRLWTDRAEAGCLVTDEPVTAVAFAADGCLAAVAGHGRVLIHDDGLDPAGLITTGLVDAGPVTAVAWNTDGRLLTGSADGAVRSWDRGRSIQVAESVRVTRAGSRVTAVGVGWHLAGDVLLLSRMRLDAPIHERTYFGDAYYTWHGSANRQDSEVVFVLAHPRMGGSALRRIVTSSLGPRPSQKSLTPLVLSLLE